MSESARVVETRHGVDYDTVSPDDMVFVYSEAGPGTDTKSVCALLPRQMPGAVS